MESFATLNPAYYLKPDHNKALLLTFDIIRAEEDEHFEGVIHPLHAKILSLCRGGELNATIKNIAAELNLEEKMVGEFVRALYENPKELRLKFGTDVIRFPKRTLINSPGCNDNMITYGPEDFTFSDFDCTLDRHAVVSDITLMLNSNCKTDCIYCYADRKTKHDQMSLRQVFALIDQAKELKVKNFDIIGGDIFAYPHWREVIQKLYATGYCTYLSTKVPITEDDVKFLAELGIKDIQVSLDTLIPEHLSQIVSLPPSYAEKIKNTLTLLDKYGIQTTIHSIVCSKNATIKDMESVYDFIHTLRNITCWRLSYAHYSLYKTVKEFKEYKADTESVDSIYKYFKSKDAPAHLKIGCGGVNLSGKDRKSDYQNPAFFKEKYKGGIKCTASYSHMFILPDGKVTICEQLYWHPDFIIGDLTRQTLLEIWTSQEAKRYFYLQRDDVSDKSACKTCKEFDDCRTKACKVCWKDVVACYGRENWDFPDPKCPKSPKPYYDVHI